MAQVDGGGSGFAVSAAGRVAEAGFREQKRQDQQRQSREQKRDASKRRQSLYDVLFEEIEQTPGLDEQAKRRLKRGVRSNTQRQYDDLSAGSQWGGDSFNSDRPADAATRDQDSGHAASGHATDADHHLRPASFDDAELHLDEQTREARRVATQLRFCLCQHTETALKVSAYLHALLALSNGLYKPTLVIEV